MDDNAIDAIYLALDAVREENDLLRQRIAIECMDATEEGKLLAHELIESLKADKASLVAELKSVKAQRDSLLRENARLKTQVINLRGKR